MVTGLIQAYLAKRLPPSPAWPFRLPGLAAAALMVECARIDGAFTEVERDAICRAVREELVLDEDTARCLVEVAERREDEVWHDRHHRPMMSRRRRGGGHGVSGRQEVRKVAAG